jgi:murein DD-endopeptidase MepM/ murein hydrolase activator NlpD
MRRLVYSPEMKVYIQPSGTDKDGKPLPPIDISSDIIDGTIERKTNDISTARFTVQGRRLGKKNETDPTTSLLLSQIIRPMDRIVVYLKKTKPILVFSGYLDLVPLVQFVPEPVTIEASCTLKRLEFTYWDPTLPNVMQYLLKSGFIVQNTDSGFNTYQVPGSDGVPFQRQDTGFSKLLSFLLIDVGGWKPGSVFIEPLPQEWLNLAESLFKEIIKDDHTWDAAKAFIESWLDLSGDGGGGGDGTPTTDDKDYREVYTSSGGGWKLGVASRFGGPGEAEWMHQGNEQANENTWGFGETATNMSKNGPFDAMGDLPAFTAVEVRVPGQPNKTIKVRKKDVGGGGKGMNYRGKLIPRVMDLNWASSLALDFTGLNVMEWRLYDKNTNPSPEDVATDQSPRSGSRTPAAGKGAVVKEKLTVYIQASGAPEYDAGSNDAAELGRMNGYQTIDQFGRSYSSVNRINAVRKNVEIVGRIQRYVQDKIDAWKKSAGKNWSNPGDQDIEVITFNSATKDSNLHGTDSDGWQGDIYLEIDHSDSERDDDYCYYSIPSPNCYKNGLQNPRIFFKEDFGWDWQKPSSVRGRDLIVGTESKGLHKNSNNFITSLKKAQNTTNARRFAKNGLTMSKVNVSKPAGPGLNKSDAAAYAWSGDIPGFYYTKAEVCVYLQLPNKSDEKYIPETDNWAWQIAEAIWDYYFNVKIAKNPRGGGQATANAATVGGSGNNSDVEGNGTSMIGGEKFFNPVGSTKWTDYGGPNSSDPTSTHSVALNAKAGTNNWQSVWAVDMKVPSGIPVFAPFSGKIERAGSLNSSDARMAGLRVGITGNNGYCTYLAHLKTITVKEGDTVVGGQQVGTSGGLDHVHFALAKTSSYNNDATSLGIDPIPFLTGASTNGSTSDGSGTGGADPNNPDLTAQNFMNAAFNVGFMFPGSMVDSLLLRGQRALENDVPLLDSVREITIASMRNFASLPNGDFIAWYPDYFNIARRNPWLRISHAELKKCTIDLSDKSLTTHVYILGNPWGLGSQPTANSDWYEKLAGTGVVTIEQPKILDSFLNPMYKNSETGDRLTVAYDEQSKYPSLEFLEKYGARPYKEQNLTIRHPVMEFFYAYHTFIQKWSEQFISTAEFTFMPELFPGMIIEIPKSSKDDPLGGITFYVQDVTHNCSYENGFSTTATLVAPGYSDYSEDDTRSPLGLVPVKVPGEAFRPSVKYKVKPRGKGGTVNGTNAGKWRGPSQLPISNWSSSNSINYNDGEATPDSLNIDPQRQTLTSLD